MTIKTFIDPVTIFPSSANALVLVAGNLGPPPVYHYELQSVTIVEDREVWEVLKQGTTCMTQSQWDNWGESEDDTEYQLDCISENLGLIRA